MQTLDMDFTDSYSFGLMQVVYDWAEGKVRSFSGQCFGDGQNVKLFIGYLCFWGKKM